MDNEEEQKRCLCLDCLYGAQPYGYLPFVCVAGKHARTMYHETFTCRHFEPCPDETEENGSQEEWQIIKSE